MRARPWATLPRRSLLFLLFRFAVPPFFFVTNRDPPSGGIRRRAFGATLPPPGVRAYFLARGVFPDPPLSRACRNVTYFLGGKTHASM